MQSTNTSITKKAPWTFLLNKKKVDGTPVPDHWSGDIEKYDAGKVGKKPEVLKKWSDQSDEVKEVKEIKNEKKPFKRPAQERYNEMGLRDLKSEEAKLCKKLEIVRKQMVKFGEK